MAQFRSFWHKGPLSPYEAVCLKSFVLKGHDLTLYSYDKIDVPEGIDLKDAASIFPEDEVFFYKANGSVSAFSNLFRYRLLHDFGDWWTDTDVICLSEHVPDAEICFGYEDETHLNGALLKASPDSEFSRTLLTEAEALGKDFEWGECGPKLITRIVNQLSLQQFAMPVEAFYPLYWRRCLDVLVPAMRDDVHLQTKGSYFLHLWNDYFREAAILKTIQPPTGSYLWEAFIASGLEFGHQVQYSEAEIQRIVEAQKLLDDLRQEVARLNQSLEENNKKNAELRSSLKESEEQLLDARQSLQRLRHEPR